MIEDQYLNGDYARKNPEWQEYDTERKARHILRLISAQGLKPITICEVGCGSGGILRYLADRLPDDVRLVGFDISPNAIARCRPKANHRLSFREGDFATLSTDIFDLLLLIDVFEHVPDYLGFLRSLNKRARSFVFHIPLDVSVQTVIRRRQLSVRAQLGHLHYFTKETALATLQDAGYQPVAREYTRTHSELARQSVGTRLVSLGLSAAFRVNADLAARLLGCASLLVLAEGALAPGVGEQGKRLSRAGCGLSRT